MKIKNYVTNSLVHAVNCNADALYEVCKCTEKLTKMAKKQKVTNFCLYAMILVSAWDIAALKIGYIKMKKELDELKTETDSTVINDFTTGDKEM